MKPTLFFFVLIISIASLGSAGYLFYLIFVIPGDHLDISRIKKSVLTESTIYYQDGKNKIGVIYSDVHRDYLVMPNDTVIGTSSEGKIPPLFIKAIIANEDKDFYNHIGISIKHFFRAAIANIKAGRIVGGGSTLSLQTAENLFKYKPKGNWDRWEKKIREIIDAFRLEAQYSKDQILEFYSNIIPVRGLGQGLSIAATHYFNKKASELNLSEIAFIAGSVNSPNSYHPFIKNNPEKVIANIERATRRRNHVLRNMEEVGAITKEEHDEAAKGLVEFRQGSFRYEENHQIDAVNAALKQEPWKSILEEKGITDLSKSEINIYTTLDYNLQKKSEFYLKRHLSFLEFRINGFKDYILPTEPLLEEKSRLKADEFYVGTVTELIKSESSKIMVKVGAEEGVVEKKFFEEFVQRTTHSGSKKKDKIILRENAFSFLKVGDPILVSTHRQKLDGKWILGIEQEPQLDGAVFILQEGEVRGMVGGYKSQGWNRAIQAKKQPGSTFKLPVYLAALELGWNPLEPLPNEPRAYPYQGEIYMPRGYPSKDKISMVWAGAKSQNLTSIYLLIHLVDHLSVDQFKKLMEFVGMAQRSNESSKAYRKRMYKVLGGNTDEQFSARVFNLAQNRLKEQFFFEENTLEEQTWDHMFYGQDWEVNYEQMEENLLEAEFEKEFSNKQRTQARRALDLLEKGYLIDRKKILMRNFLRFKNLAEKSSQQLIALKEAFDHENKNELINLDLALLEGFYLKNQPINNENNPTLAYTPPEEQWGEEWAVHKLSKESLAQLKDELPLEVFNKLSSLKNRVFSSEEKFLNSVNNRLKGIPLSIHQELILSYAREWKPLELDDLLVYQQLGNDRLIESFFRPENIWIDGEIRSPILATANDIIGQTLESEVQQLRPYTPEQLFYHHDFRILLALRTVVKISKIIGVQNSEIKPILSFPLGANEISLDELTMMYQTYVSGNIFTRPESPLKNTWKLIDRIEDSKGNIIYQDKQIRKEVIPEETTHRLREILRSVVEYGTGRNLKSFMKMSMEIDGGISSFRIPAFGKTGTTNDYKDATFAGFIPEIKGGEASPTGGYAIASYVGLDRQVEDSEPFPFKLTGNTGALPIWSRIAKYIINTSAYRNKIDWVPSPDFEQGDMLPVQNLEGFEQAIYKTNGTMISKDELEKIPIKKLRRKVATVFLPPLDLNSQREMGIFKEMAN